MGNKEYIERGALLKTPPFTKFGGDSSEYAEGYLECAEDARKAVKEAPAADVVEVVRCKDCKYWGGPAFGHICREWTGLTMKHYTKQTEFCCRGERKEQT